MSRQPQVKAGCCSCATCSSLLAKAATLLVLTSPFMALKSRDRNMGDLPDLATSGCNSTAYSALHCWTDIMSVLESASIVDSGSVCVYQSQLALMKILWAECCHGYGTDPLTIHPNYTLSCHASLERYSPGYISSLEPTTSANATLPYCKYTPTDHLAVELVSEPDLVITTALPIASDQAADQYAVKCL